MERLTNSDKEIPTLFDNAEYWLKVYFKLKDYEDLEEQGRLVKLPYNGNYSEKEDSALSKFVTTMIYYESLNNRLAKVFGKSDGLLEELVKAFEDASTLNVPKDTFKSVLLTNEDVDKYEEYEQLEEQGRLIKLPVKDDTTVHRECVHIKSTCYHENYKCSECPLTELFCDEFYKAIDRCHEEAYASGCLAGMDLAKSETDKISTSPYYDVYSKALDDLLNSLPDCDYVGIERLVCLVEQLKRGGENEERS